MSVFGKSVNFYYYIRMSRIAQFPDFEPVSIDSKAGIEELIAGLPPYSDFNFVSMYSWNLDNKMQVSHLNNNLVVLFKDYTSDDKFLSLIGQTAIDETINILINYASLNGLQPALHMVPEHVIHEIKHPSSFIITEDRDNHDYIVLALKLSQLKGEHYAGKRNGVNKFLSSNEGKVSLKKLKLDDDSVKQIVEVFHKWRSASNKDLKESESELLALTNLIKNAHNFDLNVIGVYVNDSMVAFSIYELLPNNYAMGHFEKALKEHAGLYDYLKHSTALDLHQQGVSHINYEQDLGLDNLRYAKTLLHPEFFLKKFSVEMAT